MSDTTELPKKELDCFGLLYCYGGMYDSNVSPCKDRCPVREECKEELRATFEREGREETERKQQAVISANLKYAENGFGKKGVHPQISPFVSEVVLLLQTCGLKSVMRKEYMTFKKGRRSVLTLSRFQGDKLSDLLKLVFVKDREEVPESIKPYVSEAKRGRYYMLRVKDLTELKEFLKKYLPTVS